MQKQEDWMRTPPVEVCSQLRNANPKDPPPNCQLVISGQKNRSSTFELTTHKEAIEGNDLPISMSCLFQKSPGPLLGSPIVKICIRRCGSTKKEAPCHFYHLPLW